LVWVLAVRGVGGVVGGGGITGGVGKLLGIQLAGVLVVLVYSAVITYLLLRLLSVVFKRSGGIRVSAAEEEVGLDVGEHHETAGNASLNLASCRVVCINTAIPFIAFHSFAPGGAARSSPHQPSIFGVTNSPSPPQM
jgi:hypothetical protein